MMRNTTNKSTLTLPRGIWSLPILVLVVFMPFGSQGMGPSSPPSTVLQSYSVRIKVILEGPQQPIYTQMDDYYRTEGLLGTEDPYGYGLNLDPDILTPIDLNAVVDWVRVELRDENDPTIIVAETAALVQRDGDVIDKDGNLGVTFDNLVSANYYVVVAHYNHLGVMTANALDLSGTPSIDFTTPATPTYSLGGEAQNNRSGTLALWAGDANGDGKINAVDLNLHWRMQNGLLFQYGITNGDFDLGGTINAADLNFYWRYNNSQVAQIP